MSNRFQASLNRVATVIALLLPMSTICADTGADAARAKIADLAGDLMQSQARPAGIVRANNTADALSGISGYAKDALSDCGFETTLRYREYCGRLHQALENAALSAPTINDTEAKALFENQRRQRTRITAANLLDSLAGHDPGLTPYGENYAVLRPDPLEMKFQVSFKYKLFVDPSELEEHDGGALRSLRQNVLSKAYFSYTQKSFWNLDAPSAPFRDINFNPQLFLYYPKVSADVGPVGYWLGVEHESNGRDGADSRSWNRVFAKAEVALGSLVFTPKIWHMFGEADENFDLLDFAGYFELDSRYEFSNGSRFHILGRRGKRKGGVEFSYSFKVPFFNNPATPQYRFDPWIHLRYWTGYGENLLTYNEKSSSLRLGVAFALAPVYPRKY